MSDKNSFLVFSGTNSRYLAEVAKANGAFTVKGYVRFETGEGLEKKNEDFAAEVAAQLQ